MVAPSSALILIRRCAGRGNLRRRFCFVSLPVFVMNLTMSNESQPLDRLLEQQRQQTLLKLESEAERTTAGSLALLVFSVIGLLASFLTIGPVPPWFLAAVILFLVALAFLIVAQLIHIRAALEKLNLK